MTGVLIRRGHRRIHTASPLVAEAETGVRWPQAKECLEPAEAEQARKDLEPSSLQRERGSADPLLWSSGLQN